MLKRNCTELTSLMIAQMKSDNYSSKSVDAHVKNVYNSLIRFCDENFERYYSVPAGEAFIKMIIEKGYSKGQTSLFMNSVERLNHALDNDFHWRPEKNSVKQYANSCFNTLVLEYESYLFLKGKTKHDVRNNVHLIAKFLAFLESKGVTNLQSISVFDIHEAFSLSKDKDGFSKRIKVFIRYLFENDLIKEDISCWIPSVSRHKPVPSVYSIEETDRILTSIDRSSRVGKRNYCIVLMAARLGIRSCDIVNLKLDNVNYCSGNIVFTQQKTDKMIELPLLPNVLEALNDYVNHARPVSSLPNIFLTVPLPDASILTTQGIYSIVSTAISDSGIDVRYRRRGAHALRSSLASQLLNEGSNLIEIQQVLGHSSPDAIRHYIKVETERLRKCSLEVPVLKTR